MAHMVDDSVKPVSAIRSSLLAVLAGVFSLLDSGSRGIHGSTVENVKIEKVSSGGASEV